MKSYYSLKMLFLTTWTADLSTLIIAIHCIPFFYGNETTYYLPEKVLCCHAFDRESCSAPDMIPER